METYTVIKKGISIKHCIQIPEEFLEEELEITIRPYKPGYKVGEKIEKLLQKYHNIRPFESIKDPDEWQREVRRDWEKGSV